MCERWCRMWIFYSNFCWFFTCIQQKILPASIFSNCTYKIANKQVTDYLDENKSCIAMELIQVKDFIWLKVTTAKNAWIVTISFLIMDSNFSILYVMFVTTCLYLNISDISIITVKDVDYCCIIRNNSKSEAINLVKNSVLEDRGYI